MLHTKKRYELLIISMWFHLSTSILIKVYFILKLKYYILIWYLYNRRSHDLHIIIKLDIKRSISDCRSLLNSEPAWSSNSLSVWLVNS